MATHDYVIDNQTAPNFRADLNNALQAIVTTNSNATAPSVTYANMLWYETDTNILWKRNEANSGWISLGTLDETNSKFEPNQTFASQAEAEAGTNNTKAMTPLRTAEAIAASGGNINYQVFTASGTWVKPAGVTPNAITIVEAWGGGGGGARSLSDNGHGGGGGGAYQTRVLLTSSLASSGAVTVGAGGTGRTSSAGNGGAGGNSTFIDTATLHVQGGNGGVYDNNSAPVNAAGGDTLGRSADSNRLWGGGRGGSNSTVGGATSRLFGGGGGAGGYSTNQTGAATSLYGGNGGGIGAAGQVLGGGGGGGRAANGGSGGRGEVRVWTIW